MANDYKERVRGGYRPLAATSTSSPLITLMTMTKSLTYGYNDQISDCMVLEKKGTVPEQTFYKTLLFSLARQSIVFLMY